MSRPTESDPRAFFARHHVGDVLSGPVVRVVPFGAFVELAEGVHGLVPAPELREPLAEGTEVRVEILALDPDRSRLSLRPA